MNIASLLACSTMALLTACDRGAPDPSAVPPDRTQSASVPGSGNRPSAESPATRASQAASESVSSEATGTQTMPSHEPKPPQGSTNTRGAGNTRI